MKMCIATFSPYLTRATRLGYGQVTNTAIQYSYGAYKTIH